jgi:hypothetical protein
VYATLGFLPIRSNRSVSHRFYFLFFVSSVLYSFHSLKNALRFFWRQSEANAVLSVEGPSELRSSDAVGRDVYQKIVGHWLIRRLSPDSNPTKIEELSKKRDEEVLLQAMGSEAANMDRVTEERNS